MQELFLTQEKSIVCLFLNVNLAYLEEFNIFY